MQLPNTGDLLLRIFHKSGIDRLLRLKHAVDAFGGNYSLALVLDDEGRILAVEHHYVDLLAELALAVDHMRGGRLVALREIGLQGGRARRFRWHRPCAGVTERTARNLETLLDVVMQ